MVKLNTNREKYIITRGKKKFFPNNFTAGGGWDFDGTAVTNLLSLLYKGWTG